MLVNQKKLPSGREGSSRYVCYEFGGGFSERTIAPPTLKGAVTAAPKFRPLWA